MEFQWREMFWYQFGAAIDVLQDAIVNCPDELWHVRLWNDADPTLPPEYSEFWNVAFHTLFWLDYYLSESAETYAPPPPFTMNETEMDAVMPDRTYTKQELLTYLDFCRNKCRTRIQTVDGMAPQQVRPNWINMSVAELMLYTMRHVMEHAAQMQLVLGQNIGYGGKWVSRTKS